MKKIFTLLFISAFIFTSCSDEGPQGPQGPPGEPGDGGISGTVLDIEGDFTEGDNYELFVDFNEVGIEVMETHAILVYRKIGEDGTTTDGQPIEVFRMLPQTHYLDGGTLQYNFDFTFFDIFIYLDGTVDFATLDAQYTQDQVFRIVVVPADFANSGIDLSNMTGVLNALEIQSDDVIRADNFN